MDNISQRTDSEYAYEDEISLVDIFAVLWRQKKYIFLVMVTCILFAAAYLFVSTPKYKITTQIRPGITGFSGGKVQHAFNVNDIVEWFNKEPYQFILTAFLKDDAVPKITARSKKGSDLVTVETFWPDQKQGQMILQKIVEMLSDTDKSGVAKRNIKLSQNMLQKGVSDIGRKLELIPIERQRLEFQKQQMEDKLKVMETRLGSLKKDREQAMVFKEKVSDQFGRMSDNTREMLSLRKALTEKNEGDKIAMLMFSNIISQNISYITNLDQRMFDLDRKINALDVQLEDTLKEIEKLKIAKQDIDLEITRELPQKTEDLREQIAVLKSRISVLSPIEVAQPPFSSMKPVKPKKAMILAVSIVAGLFLGMMFAFFKEFVDKNRKAIAGGGE